jgi:tetratricopeptide (TPR) repeat protein
MRFNHHRLWIICLLALLLVSLAMGQSAKVKSLLTEAEKLHDAKDYQGTMAKLQEAEKLDQNNPEILWKIARAYFDFADQDPENLELQKKNIYPGFEYAKRCVEIAPNVAGGHQYYAILIGRIGEIEGTKQKIINSYAVKEHTLKAIELDPTEDSNYHVMGRWNYALADLSWVERQIASVIYAKPPVASFESAVEFFNKAHELNPTDIRHLLWLGKSYEKLGQKDKAIDALKQALAITVTSESEKNMHKEAEELLKDIQ